MVTSVNSSLLNSLLASQSTDSTSTTANAAAAKKAVASASSQAALQRVAGTYKFASAGQALEASQQKLAADLRGAMEKAGVKLSAAVDFSVSSSGAVDIKGTDADKAAMKAFLASDTSSPSFASRIATQAQDAMKLSSNIQQSAAISQAAKFARNASGVTSLYASMMQQATPTTVVFTVSSASSSLSYPGALTAQA